MHDATLDRIFWAEAEPLILRVNRDLAEALKPIASRLKKNKSDFFYRGSYPFGELIIQQGKFKLRSAAARIDDNDGPPQGLDREIPLCIPLEKNLEVFIETKNMNPPVRPLRVLKPGEMFGVFENLDRRFGIPPGPESQWSVSAGNRSAQLIYPLGNAELKSALDRRLRGAWPEIQNYAGKRGPIPENEVSRLLKELSLVDDCPWRADVIILPNQWVENYGPHSVDLERLIVKHAWKQSQASRRASIRPEALIELLSRELWATSKVIGEGSTIAFLDHLQSIAAGESIAYRPVRPFTIQEEVDYDYEDESLPDACGPFGLVLDRLHMLLKRPLHELVILEPFHLEPGQSGWCSIHCPSRSDIVTGNLRSNTDLLRPFSMYIDRHRSQCEELLPDLNLESLKIFCKFGKKENEEVNTRIVYLPNEIPEKCPEFHQCKLHVKTGFFLGCIRVSRKRRE